jgi:ribosome-associated toxin RatA of RatAB toxin-antitoxin module
VVRHALKGCLLKWIELEKVDNRRHIIDFVQIDGDLERFEGTWQAAETGSGLVNVHLRAEFDIGIPLLTRMLTPVAAKVLQESHEEILRSICQKARAPVSRGEW